MLLFIFSSFLFTLFLTAFVYFSQIRRRSVLVTFSSLRPYKQPLGNNQKSRIFKFKTLEIYEKNRHSNFSTLNYNKNIQYIAITHSDIDDTSLIKTINLNETSQYNHQYQVFVFLSFNYKTKRKISGKIKSDEKH